MREFLAQNGGKIMGGLIGIALSVLIAAAFEPPSAVSFLIGIVCGYVCTSIGAWGDE